MNEVSQPKIGLKREIIDKFYTSPFIANKCIDLIKKYIYIHEDDICIEPSAGNGSFINSIKTIFKSYIFYDLKPENDEIVEQDYLSFDHNTITKKNKIHVIGNPPFGRQSSLAIKFIKKSCEYCDSVSFILPKSFKKDSLKQKFPKNFHLIHEYDLPKNSFIIDEKEYDVPCVFQIWIKKNTDRPISKKQVPSGYSFVKKSDNPDLSFRRVGVNAGNISKNIQDKSEQSHYFIKLNKGDVTDDLIDSLSSIKFECSDYTVGPKSISKQDLIEKFNSIL